MVNIYDILEERTYSRKNSKKYKEAKEKKAAERLSINLDRLNDKTLLLHKKIDKEKSSNLEKAKDLFLNKQRRNERKAEDSLKNLSKKQDKDSEALNDEINKLRSQKVLDTDKEGIKGAVIGGGIGLAAGGGISYLSTKKLRNRIAELKSEISKNPNNSQAVKDLSKAKIKLRLIIGGSTLAGGLVGAGVGAYTRGYRAEKQGRELSNKLGDLEARSRKKTLTDVSDKSKLTNKIRESERNSKNAYERLNQSISDKSKNSADSQSLNRLRDARFKIEDLINKKK